MAFFAIIGMIVGAGLLVVGSALLNGWVLSILWGWFMVPVFHLPALTVAPAIGIALTIGYLTKHSPSDVEEKERTSSEKVGLMIGKIIVQPLLALLVGRIVHGFM